MIVLAAASLLMSISVASPRTPQARPPQKKPQPAQNQLRQLLDAPVYYLTFRMHIDASGADSTTGDLPSSYSVSLMRDVEGDITLGGRSQGASLSMMDMIPKDPSKLNDPSKFDPTLMDPTKLANNYCTWMAGAIPAGETDTDANRLKYMNNAIMDYRGSVRYSGEFHSKEPISESDELEDIVSNKNYEGKAKMSCQQPPMFEINGLKKTFKLLVAYDFFDQKDDSATGETVTTKSSSRGSKTDHTPIKQALWQSRPVLEGSTEPTIKLEGKLPTSGAAISGSWSYPVVVDDIPGTMTITAVLTPTRAEQVELVVTPPKDYAAWRPMGGTDETDPGNSIAVSAHLQKVGGGVPLQRKLKKIEVKLLNTSNEKGVCMNWPAEPDEKLPFDLKFVQDANKDYLVDAKGQSAKDTTPQPYDAAITVTSFDYGGSAELQIIGTLDNDEQVVGKVKGSTDLSIYLPKRANANSFVALSFLKKYGVQSLPDSDDAEDKPVGNGFKGDGLTLYEEYRGFREGGKWITCNPKRKELMLVNQMRGESHTWKGIAIYEAATKIKVHKNFVSKETNEENVINFNHTSRPHVVDQHALFINPGKNLAEGEHAARVRHVGPPGLAVDVSMPPDWAKWIKTSRGYQADYAITIAHEMIHGASVNHHGNTDVTGLLWYYGDTPGPHWIEQEGHYDKANKQWVQTGPTTNFVLLRENGQVIAPAKGKFFSGVWLTTFGGQHSGNNECIMKYNCATGYPGVAVANTRYLTGDEYAGVILCSDDLGTGVNDANRSLPVGHPQPRQGPADLGDCIHQLCINDLYVPPPPPLAMTNMNGLLASMSGSRLPLQDDGQDDTVEPSTPTIVVGANDISGQHIKPGWPVIVSATLIGADGTASAISPGLTPKLIGLSGKAIELSFEPLVSDGPDKTLTYWIAKEGSTSGLAVGDYLVTLTGSTSQAIAPGQISVKTGDELTDVDKSLLRIQLLLITGKTDDALSEANQLIASNPGNVAALTVQGDILMARSDFDGAMAAYSQAISLLDQSNEKGEDAGDELSENLQLHIRLRDAMKASLDALPDQ